MRLACEFDERVVDAFHQKRELVMSIDVIMPDTSMGRLVLPAPDVPVVDHHRGNLRSVEGLAMREPNRCHKHPSWWPLLLLSGARALQVWVLSAMP